MIEKNWQSLIKSGKLEVHYLTQDLRSAEIIAEPLECGFGMTLGNALRRVLLSSLQGAAITSVKIEGVLHEFSAVPGVRDALSLVSQTAQQKPHASCQAMISRMEITSMTTFRTIDNQ